MNLSCLGNERYKIDEVIKPSKRRYKSTFNREVANQLSNFYERKKEKNTSNNKFINDKQEDNYTNNNIEKASFNSKNIENQKIIEIFQY